MRAPFLSFCSMLLLGSSAAAQKVTPIQPDDFTHEGANGVTLVKDPVAPLSFELPQGWFLENGVRCGDHPLQTPLSSDAGIALGEFVELKVRQRGEIEGLSDYHVRQGSIHMRNVSVQPALSFYAEFTSPGSMNRYMLRLKGAGIKAQFFVTAATDFAGK